MKRILTGLVSAVAFAGLAACSDTDDTTTQGVDPDVQEQAPLEEPTDDTTTQGVTPDEEGSTQPAQ
ncbi:hypothetical protein [Nitratireductor luteus]|uniref:hypothetical protein n=1 Tax=Nitratireductor luteus TaxID=2976980 RepID=UPI00223FA163|nr:hypothetical protein [Nitratireductor luteus]